MSGTLSTNGVCGGVVTLPAGIIDLGKTPLLVWPTCTLSGAAINATLLKYSGKGAAVRFLTYATNGYCSAPTVSDLAIRSEADGIAFDTSVTGSDGALIRNVLLDCAGKPISLANTTMASIEHVVIQGWGDTAFETIGCLNTSVDGLKLVNNTRAKSNPSAAPIFRWDGSGKCANLWIEDNNNRPLIQASNTIEFISQYLEAHSYGIPQVILNNCVATAQRTYYADQRSWWQLNNSTLEVAGTVGDVDPKTAYQCDQTSKVISCGKVVAGVGS